MASVAQACSIDWVARSGTIRATVNTPILRLLISERSGTVVWFASMRLVPLCDEPVD